MTDYNDLWELDRGDYVSIITELRADLAEARADVQRFEQALDAANKELAQARAERDEAIERRSVTVASEENLRFLKQLWEQECGYYRAKWWASHQANDRSRATIAALVVACRAIWQIVRDVEMDAPGALREGASRVRRDIKKAKAKQAGE